MYRKPSQWPSKIGLMCFVFNYITYSLASPEEYKLMRAFAQINLS